MRTEKLRSTAETFCARAFGDSTKHERLLVALKVAAKMVIEWRNTLKYCPTCDQPINDVKTDYTDATSIKTLYALYAWCKERGRHEFESSMVKHLLDHTQYANLNHLDRFGGIMYRPIDPKTKKPYRSKFYGINMSRAREFFANERAAPVQIITNRLTGERVASTEKLMRDFPGMEEFLDDRGFYDPEHIVSDDKAVPRKDGLPTVPGAL